MQRSTELYDNMRKYDYIFLLSHHSPNLLHVIRKDASPALLCKLRIHIHLCYYPETEPRSVPICDTCIYELLEALKQNPPSIIRPKRKKSLIPSSKQTKKRQPYDDQREVLDYWVDKIQRPEEEEKDTWEKLSRTTWEEETPIDDNFHLMKHYFFCCESCSKRMITSANGLQPCKQCQCVMDEACSRKFRKVVYDSLGIRIPLMDCIKCFFLQNKHLTRIFKSYV